MMAANNDGSLGLDDEDRLPWLEAAEGYDEDPGVSTSRLIALVLAGLVLVGAIVGGMWWLQQGSGQGQGDLIAAPQGNFKVAPADPDARVFEGEGDSSFAASEGTEPLGKVDAARVAEAPVAASGAVVPVPAPVPGKAPPPAAATPQTKVAAVAPPKSTVASAPVRTTSATPAVKPAVKAAGSTPAPATKATAAASGGGTIQLGAFSSEASAAKAWDRMTGRFAYLKGYTRQIAPVAVEDGTVYRLRVGAGGQASDICNRLKVAGETCILVK